MKKRQAVLFMFHVFMFQQERSMPVEHMVWIKFKEGVAQVRVDEHIRNLATLKGRVPGIVVLTLGENFTNRSEGYTILP